MTYVEDGSYLEVVTLALGFATLINLDVLVYPAGAFPPVTYNVIQNGNPTGQEPLAAEGDYITWRPTLRNDGLEATLFMHYLDENLLELTPIKTWFGMVPLQEETDGFEWSEWMPAYTITRILSYGHEE